VAIIVPSVTPVSSKVRGYIVTWAGLGQSDQGEPVQLAHLGDRSIQVEGTFGSGGQVDWRGSNDSVNYRTLTDPQGNALSISGAKIETVMEATFLAKPVVTNGDGTTNLTVTLFVRVPPLN